MTARRRVPIRVPITCTSSSAGPRTSLSSWALACPRCAGHGPSRRAGRSSPPAGWRAPCAPSAPAGVAPSSAANWFPVCRRSWKCTAGTSASVRRLDPDLPEVLSTQLAALRPHEHPTVIPVSANLARCSSARRAGAGTGTARRPAADFGSFRYSSPLLSWAWILHDCDKPCWNIDVPSAERSQLTKPQARESGQEYHHPKARQAWRRRPGEPRQPSAPAAQDSGHPQRP